MSTVDEFPVVRPVNAPESTSVVVALFRNSLPVKSGLAFVRLNVLEPVRLSVSAPSKVPAKERSSVCWATKMLLAAEPKTLPPAPGSALSLKSLKFWAKPFKSSVPPLSTRNWFGSTTLFVPRRSVPSPILVLPVTVLPE